MDKSLLHLYQTYSKWEKFSRKWGDLKNTCDPGRESLQEEVIQALTTPLPETYSVDSSGRLVPAGPANLLEVFPKEEGLVSEDPAEQLEKLIAFGKQSAEKALQKELAGQVEQESQDMQTARNLMEQSGEPVSLLDGRKLRSYSSLDFSYGEAAQDLRAVQEELEMGNLVPAAEHYLFERNQLATLAVYKDGRRALKDVERQEKVKGLGILIASAASGHLFTGGAILAGFAPEAAATFAAPLGFIITQRAFHNSLWNQDLSVGQNLFDWSLDYTTTASMFKYVGAVTRGLVGETAGPIARYGAESVGFATWAPMENVFHQALSGQAFDESQVAQTAGPEALLDQQLTLLALKAGGYPMRDVMKPLDRVVMQKSFERAYQKYFKTIQKTEQALSPGRPDWVFELGGISGDQSGRPIDKLVEWWRQRNHVPLPLPQFQLIGSEQIAALIRVALQAERAGHRAVATEIYGTIAIAMAKSGKTEMALELLQMLGHVLRDSGELDAAKEIVALSRELYPPEKNELAEGNRLGLLADIFVREGNSDASIGLYEKAAKIYAKHGEKELEAKTLGAIGEYFSDAGQYDRALEALNKSALLFEEIGDHQMAVAIRSLAVEVKQKQGLGPRESKTEPMREGRKNEVEEIVGQARDAARKNRLDEAIDLYRSATDTCKRIGYTKLAAVLYTELAEIFERKGFFLDAAVHYGRAHFIFGEEGDVQNQSLTLHYRKEAVAKSLGEFSSDEERLARAGEQYEKLAKMHQAAGEMNWVVGSYLSAASNFLNGGKPYKALERAREALRLAEENGLEWGVSDASQLIKAIEFIQEPENAGSVIVVRGDVSGKAAVPMEIDAVAPEKRIVEMIRNELINPDFDESLRRGGSSIFSAGYREILDPYVGGEYPLNAIGTFARVVPDYLESYVNIGKLIDMMRSHVVEGELAELLKLAESNGEVYAQLRLTIREAIHSIGDLSYTYEWRDSKTFKNIDTLLEGLAHYKESNRLMAEQLKLKIIERASAGQEIVVLDLGSGVGGSSIQLFELLEEMRQQNQIPTDVKARMKIVLLDVSDIQTAEAARQLMQRFGFSNVERVQGNFGDIDSALKKYRGKIDMVISGAALCHVTTKNDFFRSLYGLMNSGGVVSFWDPAISQYHGHYLRVSPDGQIRIRYKVAEAGGEVYEVEKGQMLPIEAVRVLADKAYMTTVEIPYDEIVIFSAGMVHMHLGQMGFAAPNISADLARELKLRLQRDLLEGVKEEPGFNLIQWYEENLANDPKIPRIPESGRTPYDLIEAVSDESEYKTAMGKAGFENYRARRHREPVPYDNDDDAIKSVIVYFYAEKP